MLMLIVYYIGSRTLGALLSFVSLKGLTKSKETREERKKKIGVLVGGGLLMFVPVVGDLVLAAAIYGACLGIAEYTTLGPEKAGVKEE